MNMVSSKCRGILSYNRAVASDTSGLCRSQFLVCWFGWTSSEHNSQTQCCPWTQQAKWVYAGTLTCNTWGYRLTKTMQCQGPWVIIQHCLYNVFMYVHFISEVHTCVSSHIEGCSSPVHSISWPVPSTHDLMCHIILQTRLIVLTRDGSSTLALVLKSPLSIFSEVLDGAFKHLVSWSTCGCPQIQSHRIWKHAQVLQLYQNTLTTVHATTQLFVHLKMMSLLIWIV